ncbi:hypothetical protein EVAR_44145_1 [Eumeta japonica]|uniref:Uncharacterized protein n=1 Tax=Eumeta variegata TaxID=151549 RepID=A0A4C1XM32_EUMVA|nr:hypothetical protein EVAR_44145_1 [Eumeta japonica]
MLKKSREESLLYLDLYLAQIVYDQLHQEVLSSYWVFYEIRIEGQVIVRSSYYNRSHSERVLQSTCRRVWTRALAIGGGGGRAAASH